MTDNTNKYKRMPSTAAGTLLRFFERSTAWLAHDHILVVKRFLWFENYSRFYLPDIQAVAICKTQVGRAWNIVLGAAVVILAIASAVNEFAPAFLIATALCAIPLAANIALGPTCICCVYTAVNVHKLPCFNRVSKARLFVQTMSPMITEVQGHISDEEMTRQAQLIPPIQRSEPGAPPRHKIVHYNGGVHVVLLVFILLAAILSVIQVVAGDEAVGWILTLAIMAQFGISIAAAARQSGTDIPSGLRLVVWTAFGQTLALPLLFIFASAATITLTFEPEGVERREMIFDGILMASAIVSGVLSILGRHLLVSFRDKYAYKRMAARAQTQTLDQTEI